MAALLLAGSAVAAGPAPRVWNAYLGYGRSQPNWHGQAEFRSITVDRVGFEPRLVRRWLPGWNAGVSLTYSDVIQPRSWFGHTYGDPDDHVRAEWACLFVRRQWRAGARLQPVVDIGSGPMWSNRRIPAATSRLNFNSQLGVGVQTGTRRPMLLEYRFGHISNGEFARRNPGWNTHSFLIGTRVR